MKVKFKNSVYERINSPLGNVGYITDIGINRSGIPIYYIEHNSHDLSDRWWPMEDCMPIVPDTKNKSVEIDFKFNVGDMVETPLSSGIIDWISCGKEEDISYMVKTSVQGVGDSWWFEDKLTEKLKPVKTPITKKKITKKKT